ncbi:unnamed protein product, partial [Gulo gulo]
QGPCSRGLDGAREGKAGLFSPSVRVPVRPTPPTLGGKGLFSRLGCEYPGAPIPDPVRWGHPGDRVLPAFSGPLADWAEWGSQLPWTPRPPGGGGLVLGEGRLWSHDSG